jgi:hypothetical protein
MNTRVAKCGFVLRPWDEVAAEFTKRTGEHMTTNNAFRIAQEAHKKLVTRLAHAGVTPTGDIEMPTNKYARWSNTDIANDLIEAVNKTEGGGNLRVCGLWVGSLTPQADAKEIKRAIIDLLDEVRPEAR